MAKKSNALPDDLAYLLDKARHDKKLMADLLSDPESVIRRNNLSINAESEEFKELTLRLYHIRQLLNKSFDDMLGKVVSFGEFPKRESLGTEKFYGLGSLTSHGIDDFTRPNIDQLKEEIIRDLKKR